jgi:hypothetical protein
VSPTPTAEPSQLFRNFAAAGESSLSSLQRPIPLLSSFADAGGGGYGYHPHLPAFFRERLRAAAESFHPAFYSHPPFHPPPPPPEVQPSPLPFLSRRRQHETESLLRMREEGVSCGPAANTAPSELSESLINKDS